MEAVNTDRRICLKFLLDIEVRISFNVQSSKFYLLAILQTYDYFLNVLLLATSHTEAKVDITTISNKFKLSFALYSEKFYRSLNLTQLLVTNGYPDSVPFVCTCRKVSSV